VDQLLKSADTAYVLVTGPRHDTIEEARYFAGRLAEGGTPPVAVVVNRVHPRFPEPSRTGGRRRPADGSARAELEANRAELEAVADAEVAALQPLTEEVGTVPVATVPLLATDVHDLAGLGLVADHLFDRSG
jgi:anion-transporting  ArsA/GET3 family ATPase